MSKSITVIDLGYGLMPTKSGGSTRLLEITKRLNRQVFDLEFVTTVGGKELYQSEGVTDRISIIPCSVYFTKEAHRYVRLLSNLIALVSFLFQMNRFRPADIVYSASDYMFDVLPAVMLKKRGCTRYCAFIHHLCASPKSRKGSLILNAISYWGQRLSFRLINKHADDIFLYDTPEGRRISAEFLGSSAAIHFVDNGIDLQLFKATARQKCEWDACFAGGLRETKGIFDAVRVWKKVTDTIPDAKLLMMGSGSEDTIKSLGQSIAENNLENNVILFGHATSDELAQNMKNSNIFLSTSHEEGWGISLCEALASGLECFVFDLPAFQKMRPFISAHERFDEPSISSALITAITELRQRKDHPILAGDCEQFISSISWDSIARREEQILAR